MADIAVLNTTADLSGKTLLTAEGDKTITGLHTFDRDPSAPFAVSASSAKVTNLDADKLDGEEGSFYTDMDNADAGTLAIARGGTGLGSGTSGGVLAFTAAGTLASSAALPANGLVKGGGAGAVPSGSSGFTINSSDMLSSSTQPRCVAYNSNVQSVNNASLTALTFDSEDVDVGTMHDTASNTSRITIPTGGDGFYLIRGRAKFATDADGYRSLVIRKNGTTNLTQTTVAANGTTISTTFEVSAYVNLVATDYVELLAEHTAGAALNIGDATNRWQQNELAVVKLW